jgi:hypothetical protein
MGSGDRGGSASISIAVEGLSVSQFSDGAHPAQGTRSSQQGSAPPWDSAAVLGLDFSIFMLTL